VKAVVLAAGRGSRLHPLTGTVPKILAPVAGRPQLWYQLHYLAGHGVRNVAINLHHRRRQVIEFLMSERLPVTAHILLNNGSWARLAD
jgi:NDP-sugar pyrophosphorylase family protein